ncbi:MAG: hypothetical protein KBG15_14795 [Kofleriaceae bacterium]|nr:hypothetical protein [Kofleriaceae bacterium]
MNKLRSLLPWFTAVMLVAPITGCKSKPEGRAPAAVASGSGAAPTVVPGVGSGAGLGSGSATVAAPTPGTTDTTGAPGVIHGDKWQDDAGEGGGFKSFKETWIYVDGEPVAAMLVAELPDIPVAWTLQQEDLDFVRGQPGSHIRKFYVRRWRLTDYFQALGIPLKKIKMVYLHGGSGVIAVPGDVLRKFSDGLRFDLTGMDKTKSRFFLPADMPHFGGFDRYAGVSVLIDKPVLAVDAHKNLIQDGVELAGIPYHGNPERGGIRIYRDGRLALVIKRNTLGAVGRITPTEPRWDFAAVLKANGVSDQPVAAADIVYKGVRTRVAGTLFANLQFATNSQASGEILLGADAVPANAILLYSKGRVPAAKPEAPEEKEAPANATK